VLVAERDAFAEDAKDRTASRRSISPSQPQTAIERAESAGPPRCTGEPIAGLGTSAAAVNRILKRSSLYRISAIEPAKPAYRYEREKPSKIIDIGIKKPDRFIGHRRPPLPKQQPRVGLKYVHILGKIMSGGRKLSATAFFRAGSPTT
jgi:hypothetical protein